MDLPNFSPRIYRENGKMKYADGRAKAELDRHAGGRISIRNWQSPADVLRHATVAVMWLRKEGNTKIDVVDPTFEALEAWYQLQEKGFIDEIGLDSHDIEARASAREVLEQYSQSDVVAALYDEDKEFSTALRDLVGTDFEYPDFSHLTVGQAVSKADIGLRKVLRESAAVRVVASMDGTADSTIGTGHECDILERHHLGGPTAKAEFVILIAPAEPRSYLVLESEEDDGDPSYFPPRTLDAEMALRFESLAEAQAALDAAIRRYPRNQFRIDEAPPIDQALQDHSLLVLQETDPRPIAPLDPTRPMYDEAGREYQVVASSEGQVVTQTHGAFGVWDRRSGECLLASCEGVRLSNERPSSEWIARRRNAAVEVLSAMHTEAAIDRAQKRAVSEEASGPSLDM